MATPLLIGGTSGLSNTPIFIDGPGQKLFDIVAYNASAAVAFVHFYDSSVAPTIGSTVPAFTVGLNTLATATIALQDGGGLFFKNGLWAAATTTLGGSSAPASALAVSVGIS
jgi:hypothetical protein